MKRFKYLEFILTVNALLLGGMLWVNLAHSPLPAHASAVAQDGPLGIPNAGAQRLEMINAIRNVSANVKALRSDLKTMEFNVRVISMPSGMNVAEKGNAARSNPQDPPVVQVTRIPAGSASVDDSK